MLWLWDGGTAMPALRIRDDISAEELRRRARRIERLWLHLRDNRLTHCVFRTTEEIIDGCCDAWNWLLAETGRIRSLCSYPWLAQVST